MIPRPSDLSRKSTWSTLIVMAGMAIIAWILVVGVRAATNWYLSLNTTADSGVYNCKISGASHFVFIQDNKAEPGTVTGALCDTLTIINKDPKLRLIAFGPHDNHQAYDGVTEETLAENQSLTITFDKAGTYTYHDHIDSSIIGYFTVQAH